MKLLALALMFLDHIGYFFFPHALPWRAVGRGAAPVFLFLTGYAPTHRFRADMLIAGLGLLAINLHLGGALLPLNILFTLMAGRALVALLDRGKLTLTRPLEWMIALVALFPTVLLLQTGTLGLMFVFCGYLQRHAGRYAWQSRRACLVFTLIFYAVVEHFALHIPPLSTALMLLTLAGVGWLLWRFRVQPVALPGRWGAWLKWPARYSLWVYALHFGALQLLTGVFY